MSRKKRQEMNEFLSDLFGLNNYYQPEFAKKLQNALSPQYQGMHTQGNIDLTNRPKVWNPETKKHSTVWSMGIGLDDGLEALIPRVSEDGRILTKQQAIDLFKKTKKHLGIFHSSDAANQYAEQLHKEQAELYK